VANCDGVFFSGSLSLCEIVIVLVVTDMANKLLYLFCVAVLPSSTLVNNRSTCQSSSFFFRPLLRSVRQSSASITISVQPQPSSVIISCNSLLQATGA